MVRYDGRQRTAADAVTARLRQKTYSHQQTREEVLNDVFDFVLRRLADEAETSTGECVKAFEASWYENGKCLVATENHDNEMWVDVATNDDMQEIFKKLNDIFEDLPYYHSGFFAKDEDNAVNLVVFIELAFR